MKIKLLRDTRILHRAGETVETSPTEGNFLVSVGSAIIAEEKKAKKTTAKKTVKSKTTAAPKKPKTTKKDEPKEAEK